MIVLILSLPGRRKQTDKEERDNKERMDCYIFKHPRASEQARERKKKREEKTYFLRRSSGLGAKRKQKLVDVDPAAAPSTVSSHKSL